MLRLLAVIVWGAVATSLLVACGQEEPDRPRTVREQIEDCLSQLDGHHSGFEDQIRPLLNDEGSMRTHETYFNASPDVSCTGCRGNNETSIRMIYSAHNAFGARIKKQALGFLNYKTCRVRVTSTGLE